MERPNKNSQKDKALLAVLHLIFSLIFKLNAFDYKF